MNVVEYLQMQRQLQINMKKANPTQGGDPYEMSLEELARFITWNHTALIVELGEALDECGWKPWASSRHVDGEAAIHEMVDAWHFFLNMMLGFAAWSEKTEGRGIVTPQYLGKFFEDYYKAKNAKNLQRQVEGYDGVSGKCSNCGRDLEELTVARFEESNGTRITYCICGNIINERKIMDKELETLRADIDRRSGEGATRSAEETAEEVMTQHQAAQLTAGYTPAGEPATLWEPPVGKNEDLHSEGVGGLANPHAYKMVMDAEQTGEPLFCFRARDFFSVQVISHYAKLVEMYGPDDTEFHRRIIDALGEFKEWQKDNVDRVRYPD